MSFKDYCQQIERISYYELLTADEYSVMEDKYKNYCVDNKLECEFYMD